MKVVTRDHFVALLQTRGSPKLQHHLPRYDLDMILSRGPCAVHEGDLAPPADWRRAVHSLLVLGSIRSDGLVDLGPEGTSDWGAPSGRSATSGAGTSRAITARPWSSMVTSSSPSWR